MNFVVAYLWLFWRFYRQKYGKSIPWKSLTKGLLKWQQKVGTRFNHPGCWSPFYPVECTRWWLKISTFFNWQSIDGACKTRKTKKINYKQINVYKFKSIFMLFRTCMKECYTVVMLLFQKLLSIFKKSEENAQIKTDVCTINVRLDNVNFFTRTQTWNLRKEY